MNTLASRLGLAAFLLVVVALLYQLVPVTLSMRNFLFVSAVLAVLMVVVAAKTSRAATHESMSDAIYNMDHPVTGPKP